MGGIRDGRGNDTLFPQVNTPAFDAAVGLGTATQIIQPSILLAEWRADAGGTVDLDNSLGHNVVVAWRDVITGYTLRAPNVNQSPLWLATTSTPSTRPALQFDGIDDLMETLELSTKLNNLTGCSFSLRINASVPTANTLGRIAWVESGTTGVPRLGYGRTGYGLADFQQDSNTRDADTTIVLTGGKYDAEGWATHTVRRSYLNGTANVDYNNESKLVGVGLPFLGYGDAAPSSRFRLGAQTAGANPGAFQVYGIKLYTYNTSDAEVAADTAYYAGLY